MKVLLISHACVIPVTWSKIEIFRSQCEIRVVVPHIWPYYGSYHSPSGDLVVPLKSFFYGKNHFHFYKNINDTILNFKPDLIHIDEEPYSFVTFQAAFYAKKLSIPYLVFTWQNIWKRYPWPFSSTEAYVLNNCAGLIGGNAESIKVFIKKGYEGPTAVIPQFGVESKFVDSVARIHHGSRLRIGFLGRFVAEKGLNTVFNAITKLPDVQLELVGAGPAISEWKHAISDLGISHQVHFSNPIASTDIWPLLRTWDVLVLPSLTKSNWKEQFGRVLIEAMAVGTCVLGSSSGEIPQVIGDAGLIFRESDHLDCAEKLKRLHDPILRSLLAARGLKRVLKNYTQERIVEQSLDFYNYVFSSGKKRSLCCV